MTNLEWLITFFGSPSMSRAERKW